MIRDIIIQLNILNNIFPVDILYEIDKQMRLMGTWKQASHWTVKSASKYGYLEVLKYHHKNGSGKWSKNTMKIAAEQGHLDIVKWLYYNKNGNLAIAIASALANEHEHILNWICEENFLNN